MPITYLSASTSDQPHLHHPEGHTTNLDISPSFHILPPTEPFPHPRQPFTLPPCTPRSPFLAATIPRPPTARPYSSTACWTCTPNLPYYLLLAKYHDNLGPIATSIEFSINSFLRVGRQGAAVREEIVAVRSWWNAIGAVGAGAGLHGSSDGLPWMPPFDDNRAA